ncbi:MAG: hypothetical protein AAGA57_03115 [Planctomycetota bacterium]
MFNARNVLARATRTGGQRWRFKAFAPDAQRAFLVQEKDAGASAWLPMSREPGAHSVWTCEVTLRPGAYRFRYYTDDGRTFLNCGDDGLTASPLRPAAAATTFVPRAAIA